MPESVKLGEDTVLQVEDPVEALRMLAHTVMRPFTKDDWYGFAGCETKDPMIGETPEGDFIIVLDGATINIIHAEDDYGGTAFKMEKL